MARQTRRARLSAERLESRTTPAVISPADPRIVTYTDVDGDRVTVKVSVGTLSANNFVFNTTFADTGHQQLQALNLDNGEFSGASVSVTAVRDPVNGGDGFANVGRVNATGVDLAAVTVDGDVGQVDAGDTTTDIPGLGALTAQSIGRFGVSTQTLGGDLFSNIAGTLGALTVKSNVAGASVVVTAAVAAHARIGKVTIGGSLTGTLAGTGQISAQGDIGPVAVNGNLEGTSATAGRIESGGRLGKVTVGGSLLGGSIVSASDMGMVTVGGNVVGENGALDTNTGAILSINGKIGGVRIGGSVIGGGADGSGRVSAHGGLGFVKVGGSLIGGNGAASGQVITNGKLAGLSLGGSLVGGGGADTGQVRSSGDMGPVNVRGDLIGRGNDLTGTIFAEGKLAGATVGGSIIGGAGTLSGAILSDLGLGAVKIAGDLRGGSGNASARVGGNPIAGVTVGGSLVGGDGEFSATIVSVGDVGSVKIAGDLRGGGGNTSGTIMSKKLAKATIGGSVLGGAGADSGQVRATGDAGQLSIAGDLRGGSGSRSSALLLFSNTASVTISGSVVGGTGGASGFISCSATLGPLRIDGDLVGGSVAVGELSFTGMVAATRIASVTVGGNVIAGTQAAGATLIDSGAIRSANDIGAVVIKGSLIGNSSHRVVISAGGAPTPGTTDVAIKSLSVGHRVEFTSILAGYGLNGLARNADAQIGAVTIGGDWVASNLVAGALTGQDLKFGTADDLLVNETGQDPAIMSKIASVLIRGQALGTPGGTDGFGIVAEQIGSLKVGGLTIPLTAGPINDTAPIPVSVTADLFVHEI